MNSQLDKFNTIRGLSTKDWGPKTWDSLFSMIIGAYPPVLDEANPEHRRTKKAFINTFCNLKYTLPCSFCRISYKQFYKELPIRPFTGGRIDLMYWLYLMKDKVNEKLIEQEKEYINNVKKKYINKKITKKEYNTLTKNCFRTVPSPPFIDVLNKYEKLRAKCSKALKKCLPY